MEISHSFKSNINTLKTPSENRSEPLDIWLSAILAPAFWKLGNIWHLHTHIVLITVRSVTTGLLVANILADFDVLKQIGSVYYLICNIDF